MERTCTVTLRQPASFPETFEIVFLHSEAHKAMWIGRAYAGYFLSNGDIFGVTANGKSILLKEGEAIRLDQSVDDLIKEGLAKIIDDPWIAVGERRAHYFHVDRIFDPGMVYPVGSSEVLNPELKVNTSTVENRAVVVNFTSITNHALQVVFTPDLKKVARAVQDGKPVKDPWPSDRGPLYLFR